MCIRSTLIASTKKIIICQLTEISPLILRKNLVQPCRTRRDRGNAYRGHYRVMSDPGPLVTFPLLGIACLRLRVYRTHAIIGSAIYESLEGKENSRAEDTTRATATSSF